MSDSVGGPAWDGALFNNAQIVNGSISLPKTGTYLNFTGGSHARLPNGVLGSSSSLSLEMWVDIDKDNKDWCKLLQFGDPLVNCPSIHCYRSKTTGFLCCTRCTGTSPAICTNQVFNGTKLHFIYAMVPNGLNFIYVNGEALVSRVQTAPIHGRRPQDIILLGAAPVPTDYTLWGSIQEFRLWSGVFTESEARVSYQLGPNFLNNREQSPLAPPSRLIVLFDRTCVSLFWR
jgi:hypothetical protein